MPPLQCFLILSASSISSLVRLSYAKAYFYCSSLINVFA
nr:MAG TPA: hypothetical protein [Caudoviricetes sp.]